MLPALSTFLLNESHAERQVLCWDQGGGGIRAELLIVHLLQGIL